MSKTNGNLSFAEQMWRKFGSTKKPKKPKKRKHRACKNCGEPVEKDLDGDFKGECEDCIENAQQQIDEENMDYGECAIGSV